MKHYMEARRNKMTGRWYGVVYHYDADGERELLDHETGGCVSEAEAINKVDSWCEDNDVEAELS